MKYASIFLTILLIWIAVILMALTRQDSGQIFDLFLAVIVSTLALFLMALPEVAMATRSRTPKNSSVAAIKRHRTGPAGSLAHPRLLLSQAWARRAHVRAHWAGVCVARRRVRKVPAGCAAAKPNDGSAGTTPTGSTFLKIWITNHFDIVAVLRRELSPEQLAQITLVQPQPFAAGSFGQVYSAQLANGKQVVIKILRPMVRELLAALRSQIAWRF